MSGAATSPDAGARAERIAVAAFESLYRGRVARVGGALVLRADEAPDSPMLNRVARLGTEEPATEEQLEEAIALLAGTRFYVTVSPDARPPELADWLQARGFTPGWGWMQFRRGVETVPDVTSELDVVELAPGEGADFARVVCAAYGAPDEAAPWIASTPEVEGWTCWLALAHGEPAGAAALYAAGRDGYLTFAGTLPEHRGKGAQGALLAERIRRARELGCDTVFTETGERVPGRPDASYRNILRAGFEELHVVPNWLSPSPGAGAA